MTGALAAVLPLGAGRGWRERASVVVQLAVAVALGATNLSEAEQLGLHHQDLFGPAASDYTAKSKTRRDDEGKWRFIRNRADLQIVRCVRAWLGDLRELGANNPVLPLFRALSTTGNLKGRSNATMRACTCPAGQSTRS